MTDTTGGDLNNNVINFYLRYLTKKRKDIFVAPTLFLKSLRENNATRYFSRTSLEGLKAIVIPAEHEKWWYLIYINVESKKIRILSTKNVPTDTSSIVSKWLGDFNAGTWKVENIKSKNLRKHEDSGVYACMFAEMQISLLEANKSAIETDPQEYRKQMNRNIWNERFFVNALQVWTPLERSVVKANLVDEFPGTESENFDEFDARVSMAAWTAEGQFAGVVLCSGKQSILSIDYLTTAPHNRGQGLGKQLMATAEARAKELGYSTAELQVDVESTELKFYESLGYKAMNRPVMVMRVPMQKMIKVLK